MVSISLDPPVDNSLVYEAQSNQILPHRVAMIQASVTA